MLGRLVVFIELSPALSSLAHNSLENRASVKAGTRGMRGRTLYGDQDTLRVCGEQIRIVGREGLTQSTTVEPPNNAQIGSRTFVLYMEVVPFRKQRQTRPITSNN